jgi:hypothetical protein
MSTEVSPYTQARHDHYASRTNDSARRILPYLIDLFRPTSMLDLGAGFGNWSVEAMRLGLQPVISVDGQWTIDQGGLLVPRETFVVHDLAQPIDLKQRFDLVLSLETGEHIAPDAAGTFADSMVRHGDLVVFSAAIPWQGGFNHLNEAWPSYWIALLKTRNFRCFDLVRPQFWDDAEIPYFYRQNTLVFVNRQRADLIDLAERRVAQLALTRDPLDLVHPTIFEHARAAQPQLTLRKVLPRLPALLASAVVRRRKRPRDAEPLAEQMI